MLAATCSSNRSGFLLSAAISSSLRSLPLLETNTAPTRLASSTTTPKTPSRANAKAMEVHGPTTPKLAQMPPPQSPPKKLLRAVSTQRELDALLAESDAEGKAAVLDFGAEWCGPCRMAAPAVAKLGAELAPRAVFAAVDIDRAGALAASFGVAAVPTVVVLEPKTHRVHATIVGYDPRSFSNTVRDAVAGVSV